MSTKETILAMLLAFRSKHNPHRKLIPLRKGLTYSLYLEELQAYADIHLRMSIGNKNAIMLSLLNRMYIARNITLDEKAIFRVLSQIDRICRDNSANGENDEWYEMVLDYAAWHKVGIEMGVIKR